MGNGFHYEGWKQMNNAIRSIFFLLLIILIPLDVHIFADKAPDGSHLPNEPLTIPRTKSQKLWDLPSTKIRPPDYKFETRMGWLSGAHLKYKEEFRLFGHWPGDDQRTAIARAMKAEIQNVASLSTIQKEEYLEGMLRDQVMLEFAEVDSDWMGSVFGTAFLDFLASGGSSGFTKAMSMKGLESAAKGSATSTGTGMLFSYIKGGGDQAELHMKTRMAILEKLIMSRCGCINPSNAGFAPVQALDGIVLPKAKGNYRTNLARLLSTYGKGKMDRPQRPIATWFNDPRHGLFKKELQKINGYTKNPKTKGQYASFLTNFLFDIEVLQHELLQDLNTTTGLEVLSGFLLSLNTGFLGGAVGGSELFMAALNAMVSAVGSGLSEWNKLTDKQRLIIGIAGMRNAILKRLLSLSGDCGCGEETSDPDDPWVLLYTLWPHKTDKNFRRILLPLLKNPKTGDQYWSNSPLYSGTVEVMKRSEAGARLKGSTYADNRILDYILRAWITGKVDKAPGKPKKKKEKTGDKKQLGNEDYGVPSSQAAFSGVMPFGIPFAFRNPTGAYFKIKAAPIQGYPHAISDARTKSEAYQKVCEDFKGRVYEDGLGILKFMTHNGNWILIDIPCPKGNVP